MPRTRRPIATRIAICITICIASCIASVALVLGGSGARPAGVHADGPAAVIVGDSLTGGNDSFIRAELQRAGLASVRVEGLSARRIAQSFDFKGRRDSGIARIRALRSVGVDPDLWVIQLGTNDLGAIENCDCPNRVAFAVTLIEQLVDEVGDDASIAWVTVHDRDRPDVADDFNTAVFVAALGHPRMTMIQWKRLAVDRPDWFLDDVHPNIVGLRAFTQMYIDDIGALLVRPFDRDAPEFGLHRAERVPPLIPPTFAGASRLR